MDEQSFWKKEISFGRKPKGDDADGEMDDAASEEAKQSIWKKEITFGRRGAQQPEPDLLPEEPAEPWEAPAAVPPEPIELPPAAAPPATPVYPSRPAAEVPPPVGEKPTPFWKRDVGLGRRRSSSWEFEKPAKAKKEKPARK